MLLVLRLWPLVLVVLSQCARADIDVHFDALITRDVVQQNVQFKLLGQAKREFLFFDIYDVANYISRSDVIKGDSVQKKAQSLIEAEIPKLLILKYHRNIDSGKIREVLLKGFQSNTEPQSWALLEREVSAFLSHLNQDIHKNDILELIWMPSNQLSIRFNQREHIQHQSDLFLRTLWRIWFGKNAVVQRDRLFAFNS